jgi:hypothetical protein
MKADPRRFRNHLFLISRLKLRFLPRSPSFSTTCRERCPQNQLLWAERWHARSTAHAGEPCTRFALGVEVEGAVPMDILPAHSDDLPVSHSRIQHDREHVLQRPLRCRKEPLLVFGRDHAVPGKNCHGWPPFALLVEQTRNSVKTRIRAAEHLLRRGTHTDLTEISFGLNFFPCRTGIEVRQTRNWCFHLFWNSAKPSRHRLYRRFDCHEVSAFVVVMSMVQGSGVAPYRICLNSSNAFLRMLAAEGGFWGSHGSRRSVLSPPGAVL